MALAPALSLVLTKAQALYFFFIYTYCVQVHKIITLPWTLLLECAPIIILLSLAIKIWWFGGAKHCFDATHFVCVCVQVEKEKWFVRCMILLRFQISDYYKHSICWLMACLVCSKLFYLFLCCLSVSHFFFAVRWNFLLLFHSIMREWKSFWIVRFEGMTFCLLCIVQ